MSISSETKSKIQELQILENNLQQFLIQRQSIQMEQNEVLNALNELKSSGDEVYKILSGIMIKADKKNTESELEERNRIFELRINSIEKQENSISKNIELLRKDIDSLIKEK